MKPTPSKHETKAGTERREHGGLPRLTAATNREGKAELGGGAPCQSEFGLVGS